MLMKADCYYGHSYRQFARFLFHTQVLRPEEGLSTVTQQMEVIFFS
jgi:hypothetical protein